MENVLFTPIKINQLEIKNRFAMAPMKSRLTVNNQYGKRGLAYYEERAKGGFGLILTEFTAVDPGGLGSAAEPGIWNDSFISSFKVLTDTVHKHGAKIFSQLHHAGMVSVINEFNPVEKGPSQTIENGVEIKELSKEEIEALIQKYIDGAIRAKQAGFDGVEIHAAHGYLLTQFLSKRINKRIDEYGGNYENRFRMIEKIIKGIRKECGESYPISMRINACDGNQLDDNTIEDTIIYCQMAEKYGVNVINLSITDSIKSYFYHPGFNAVNAKKVKDAVSIPVMVVGRINSGAIAHKIISQGAADCVVLGRESVADPHFPEKVMNDKEISIFHCAGCMQRCNPQVGCEDGDDAMSCIFNPFTGKEDKWIINPVKDPKKIAIIGAGCAGMQAAWILAKRGYKVDLYEKSNRLGGLLYYAGIPEGKNAFHQEIMTLEYMCKKEGVQIHLNQEINEKNVEQIEADVFILSIGSSPIVPRIKGLENNSVTAQDVLSGKVNLTGKKVAVLGGGLVGCETADWLAERNNVVSIIEMKDSIAAEMNPIVRNDFMLKMHKEGKIEMLPKTKVLEIVNNELMVEKDEKEKSLGSYDKFVLAFGYRSNPIQDCFKTKEWYALGDANKVSDAKHNIYFATKFAILYGGEE